jgi:hypothetical protein
MMIDPALEEVLDAFAVEATPGRETLERYLRRYPQFAPALIDLSRELRRELPPEAGAESTEDQARIETAWGHHRDAGAPQSSEDAFAGLSIDQLRALAKVLDVPRQVITAFRDRRVILETVPQRFLEGIAAGLNRSLEALLPVLSPTQAPVLARSHKSDVKPTDSDAVTFERVLIDAGVPEDKRSRLLAEVD